WESKIVGWSRPGKKRTSPSLTRNESSTKQRLRILINIRRVSNMSLSTAHWSSKRGATWVLSRDESCTERERSNHNEGLGASLRCRVIESPTADAVGIPVVTLSNHWLTSNARSRVCITDLSRTVDGVRRTRNDLAPQGKQIDRPYATQGL